MAQPYVGEIRMFAGSFAPAGWMFCDGQLLPISENETLFILIGTTYGGDGQTTFALPDLRGRLPMHQGTGLGLTSRVMSEQFGTETVTLTNSQMPTSHAHTLAANSAVGTVLSPVGAYFAASGTQNIGFADAADGTLNAAAIVPNSGGQPHSNLQPYLCISFIISLFGIFPSPT